MRLIWSRGSIVTGARSVGAKIAGAARALFGVQAEILDALAIVVGWCALTYGLASVFEMWELYPISLGLFLLSIVGWGHLRKIFTVGLYTLSRDDAPPMNRPRRRRREIE